MELRHISAHAAGIGNKVVGRSHPSTKIPMHNLNENWYLTPPPPLMMTHTLTSQTTQLLYIGGPTLNAIQFQCLLAVAILEALCIIRRGWGIGSKRCYRAKKTSHG